jgi:2'-5' RNA ligase
VTLRFLGPTPAELVAGVGEAVRQVAAVARPFDVRLRGAGGFPSPRRPRVLWLGLADGEEAMAALAHDLDGAIAPLGWERDRRPFRGHLTVARADGRREGPLATQTLIAAVEDWEVAFRAEHLTLFESLTGGGPARYVPRLEVALGG